MSGLPMRITPVPQSLFTETYGSSLICAFVSLPLFGISLLQTYLYFLNYPEDRRWIKSMVTSMIVLESLHQYAICNTVFHYTILSYSRPEILPQGEWSSYFASGLGTLICLIAEIYFARMVYFLVSNRIWRATLLVVYTALILSQVGFGLYVVIQMYRIWDLTGMHAIVHPGLIPMYVIRVVVDSLTAIILCVTLYGAAQHAPHIKGSVKLFRTLMVYAMNRFLLMSILVIVQTVALIIRPHAIWPMELAFVTAHLYVNSILATLNARGHLRSIGHTHTTGTEASTLRIAKEPRSQSTFAGAQSGGKYSQHSVNVVFDESSNTDAGELGGVKVDTETYVMSDLSQRT